MLTILLNLKKYKKQMREPEKERKSVEIEGDRNAFLVSTMGLAVS